MRALFWSVMCAVLVSLVRPALAASLKEGDPFPKLEDFGLEGSLPDLAGKVVLVDFFASWCEPCRDSFPVMEELQKKYAAKGLIVVAINVDQNIADMKDFLKQHPASFLVLRDAGKRLVARVKIPTMPSSFLLDRSGKVHSVHRGFRGDETRQKYVTEIESLLK